MLILANTSTVLHLITINTNNLQYVVDYDDISNQLVRGTFTGTISTIGTTTIASAPSANTGRNVKQIIIKNVGISSSNLQIQKYDGTNSYDLFPVVTINPQEQFVYVEHSGFVLLDATGIPKVNSSAYSSSTLAYTVANLAYAQANAAYTQANSSSGNAAYGQANAAYTQANVVYGQANAAYYQANNAYTTANSAQTTANIANTNASVGPFAYAQANAAYAQANNAPLAYARANAALLQANQVGVYNVSITANLTATQNDYSPLGFVNTTNRLLLFAANGGSNVSGLSSLNRNDGTLVIIINTSNTDPIVFLNQSANSNSGNQFLFPNQTNMQLDPNEAALFFLVTPLGYWMTL